MSITLNDTMDTAKVAMDHAADEVQHAMSKARGALDPAKATMEHAGDEAQHAVSKAREALFDGIKTLASAVSTVRDIELDDVLGFVGLARRRSAAGSLILFGAGLVVGTGVGFLFAPVSGAEARRTLFNKLKGVEGDAMRTARTVESKAEALAGKAKTAVVNAEHKLEDLAAQAKDSLVHTERNGQGARPATTHAS